MKGIDKVLLGIVILMVMVGIAGGIAFTILAFTGFFEGGI